MLPLALLAAGTLAFSSCKKNDDTPATPSLYTRLGGNAAITKVVNDFAGNVVAETQTTNSKLLRTFKPLVDAAKAGDPTRANSLVNNLINQIGQASGGPEKYMGKDMVTAHKGMKITDDEFTALVNELVKALDKNSVPAQEKTELLTVLGGLKGQIVGQ